ncbi:MAG: glycerol-3-phosphate dehydrogenase [Legionellales bacterium]|nr:glycerol-3-phosphate dehydrogenase [Legionellales bacterium]
MLPVGKEQVRKPKTPERRVYDMAVIGGGINGAAIAADAAGRGLSVFLCEKNDVASGTSSASSKLIHGGLRYLEFFDLKLVRESLRERKILLQRAPHLVYPLSFIMPDNPQCHSPWLIRMGLFLYDFLANDKQLPSSKRINLAELPIPSHLKKQTKGFRYADCWGDDARLVIANLQLAKRYGANITTHTELVEAVREGSYWLLRFNNAEEIRAKVLINATGAWVDKVNERILPTNKLLSNLRLVKGSHIVIKRFYEGDHAFILQNDDGRVVFVIPFQKDKVIIGTTDVMYEGSLESVSIDAEEIGYLKKSVEMYFDIEITPDSILWSYSGIRALYDSIPGKKPGKMSRDYFIQLQEIDNLPLITVYGGKLTTHRCLAETVLKKLKKYYPEMSESWTKNAILPGGETGSYQQYFTQCQTVFPWVPLSMLKRLVQTYGSNIHAVLGNAKSIDELGICFGLDLYEAEVNYLLKYEWAKTAEDIIWRRTKLGLYLIKDEVEELKRYIPEAFHI